MTQDIITGIIIAVAIVYALFSFYRMLYPPHKAVTGHCQGCHGGCEIKGKRLPHFTNEPAFLSRKINVEFLKN